MNNRLRKAMGSFMKLKSIWNSNKFSLKTKLRLFKSLVMPVLFYGCETWEINESDNKKLDTFLFKCLRRILKIRWPYVISNNDILKKTNLTRTSEEVKARWWKLIGHVLKMDNNCPCMTALSWCPECRRKVGRPRTTWRRTVEKERNSGMAILERSKAYSQRPGVLERKSCSLMDQCPKRIGEVR